jgi:hypothetical protein
LQDDDAIIQIARSVHHRELLVQGLGARIADVMEQQGVRGIGDDIRDFVTEAEKLQQPRYLWQAEALRGLQAAADGDFDKVRSQITKTMAWGERTRGQRPNLVVAVQTWRLCRDEGELQSIAPRIEAAMRDVPGIPAWRCVWAQVCCEMDLRSEGRKAFAPLAHVGFATLPRDRYWIAGICVAAEVCAFLKDHASARVLYDLLAPYANRYVVVGPTAACLGSAAHYLGLLASTMARWSDADVHFRYALAANDHIKPMMARTHYEYANILLKRGRSSDQKAALRLLNAAREAPVVQRMPSMMRGIRDLLSRATKN